MDAFLRHHGQSQCKSLMLAALLAVTPAMTGCAGFWGHLGYWSGASLIDAEYGQLEGQRVAVICVSDSSSYGTGKESRILARNISNLLAEKVPDIELVPHSEVADWIDKNGWDSVDYREVGSGVKADRVVAIDLEGFSLHEDKVLYKARAAMTVTVLDMTDGGREVFKRNLPEITYPTTGFHPRTETSESTFQQVFLKILAKRAARYFYEYDRLAEQELDSADITRL